MTTCGLSELTITPPLGAPVPGQFYERYGTGTKDDLFVKCLVIENALAIAVWDAVDVAKSAADRIRHDVSKQTGIPAANIVISATHTHTGGPSREAATEWSIDESYLDWLTTRTIEALVMAHSNRQPVRIGFGEGHEDTVAFNRRFHMADGTVRTNPGVGNPNIVAPAGPIDPQVQVIRIDDLTGRPLGLISNYACHADTVGGTEYSADFPGAISTTIKEVLRDHVVSVYMQGACGNINHVDTSGRQNTEKGVHHEHMGRLLASVALNAREQSTPTDTLTAHAATATMAVPFRRPTAEQVAAARATTVTPDLPIGRRLPFAEQVLELAKRENHDAGQAEITVFALGTEAAIVCLPGEIFVEFGLQIKQASPFGQTIINELSNGSVYGYICTREAYHQGGYEPALRTYNRTAEDTGERFVVTSILLLEQLHAAVPS